MKFLVFRIRCNVAHKHPAVTLSFEQDPQAAVYFFVGNGSGDGENGTTLGKDFGDQKFKEYFMRVKTKSLHGIIYLSLHGIIYLFNFFYVLVLEHSKYVIR